MTDERWYRAEEYPGEHEGHEAWEFYEPRGYVVQTFVNKGYSREPAHNGALWFMRIRRPAPPAEAKPFGDNTAIRSVIAERDALLEERQRFEARLFDMAETGNQARAERDALREALQGLLRHSGVADMDPEDKSPGDIEAERSARAALEPQP